MMMMIPIIANFFYGNILPNSFGSGNESLSTNSAIDKDGCKQLISSILTCIISLYIFNCLFKFIYIKSIRMVRKITAHIIFRMIFLGWLMCRAVLFSTTETPRTTTTATISGTSFLHVIVQGLNCIVHTINSIAVSSFKHDGWDDEDSITSSSSSLGLRLRNGAIFFACDIIGIVVLAAIINSISSIKQDITNIKEIQQKIIEQIVDFLTSLPIIQKEIQKEENKIINDLEVSLKDPNRIKTLELPKVGISPEILIANIEERSTKENLKWINGKVSGTVYSGEDTHTNLMNKTYASYSLSNPLHTDIWPSINQFEAEVCYMTSKLLGATSTNGCYGCISSGGTESIVLSAKAHYVYYCKKHNIDVPRQQPEIISCYTSHAGIDKACEILKIKNVKVNYDPNTYKMDVNEVLKAINENTIMIYSSAPNYPQGVIDPIEELSNIAVQYDVGLHVDCCLGGYILPFAADSLLEIPKFDFRLSGVTSISCDTHKYGYGSKGTSVILYKHKELRRSQYFAYPQWSGGLYSTPTIAGSRPGGLIACAWTSLMSMGYNGYKERATIILKTAQYIATTIEKDIDGLYLLGSPKAMIVCFSSKSFNIYRVADGMSQKGRDWSLNSLQNPPSIHLCVTIPVAKHADDFLDDLRSVVNEILDFDKKNKSLNNKDKEKSSKTAAMYGKAGSLPSGPVSELLKSYTDVMLNP